MKATLSTACNEGQRTAPAAAAVKVERYGEHVFGIDLRALAAFRIALSALLLVDLVQRATDLRAHYSDAGVLPRDLLADAFRLQFSFHTLSGSTWVEAGLFLVAGAAALALLVGYCTWFATFVSWALMVSVQARNPLILQGSDVLLRLLLFWSLFLPLSGDFQRFPGAPGQPVRFISLGSAGILLQFAAIYLFTAALKRHPWWSQDNTAIFHALQVEQFTTNLARPLLHYPTALKALTFFVYRMEWIGPLLLFLPWFTPYLRMMLVAFFVAIHLGMALTLQLGLFPWVCIAGWLLFLPSSFWDWVAQGKFGRWRFSRMFGRDRADITRYRQWPVQLAAGATLMLVLLWNLRSLELPGRRAPTSFWYDDLVKVLRLEQRWTMFAPRPSTDSGWYVVPARLANGREVDLCRAEGNLSWMKPANVAKTYANQHWRKYLIGLRKQSLTRFRDAYLNYLCREWNAVHPAVEHVAAASIYLMVEDLALPPPKNTLRKVLLCTWRNGDDLRDVAAAEPTGVDDPAEI